MAGSIICANGNMLNPTVFQSHLL